MQHCWCRGTAWDWLFRISPFRRIRFHLRRPRPRRHPRPRLPHLLHYRRQCSRHYRIPLRRCSRRDRILLRRWRRTRRRRLPRRLFASPSSSSPMLRPPTPPGSPLFCVRSLDVECSLLQ